MTQNEFKKYKEFQALLPLVKKLGFDEQQLEKLLIKSERPDFLFDYKGDTIGIEVTECHPDVTKGENAKNLQAARQRTYEICTFIEKTQDELGEIVNYRLGFNFALLFELQKPKLKRPEKERIQNEVLSEMRKRIQKGDYITIEDAHVNLHREWAKDYHYIRDIIVEEPLEKSIVTYSYPARGATPLEHSIVLRTIAYKEEKLLSYRDNRPEIKEFWLCINLPMGIDYTTDGLQDYKVNSSYDRVYVTSVSGCVDLSGGKTSSKL